MMQAPISAYAVFALHALPVKLGSVDVITHQVVFNDSSSSGKIFAVQADDDSSYMAEETYFVGFAGEVYIPDRILLF